jgi:hypothetical protein
MSNTLQKVSVASLCLFVLMIANIGALNAKTQDYIPVSWNQLIPADYDYDALEAELIDKYYTDDMEPGSAEAEALLAALQQLQDNAPMTTEYDAVRIKIPGFVVPLEFDGDKVTHFLLVPYFGACIHTPPPPPNQLVYVILQEAVQIDDTFDPVYVNGLMRVEHQNSELGAAGYTLYAESIEPYL